MRKMRDNDSGLFLLFSALFFPIISRRGGEKEEKRWSFFLVCSVPYIRVSTVKLYIYISVIFHRIWWFTEYIREGGFFFFSSFSSNKMMRKRKRKKKKKKRAEKRIKGIIIIV